MDKQSLWPLPLLKRRAQYCVCTTVYNVVHCTCYSHSNVLLTQYRILNIDDQICLGGFEMRGTAVRGERWFSHTAAESK